MPVHAVDPLPAPGDFRTGEIGVWFSSSNRKLVNIGQVRSAMPANRRNNAAAVVAAVQQALQNALDVRIPRASLPLDDPDLLTDPARPDLFWDGPDLVGRSVLATVGWDASTSRYTLMLQRVGGQNL